MLAIQSLTVSYNSSPVLRNVSIEVKAGEIVALVGPNGAGKSTLVNAVSGLVRPEAGRILLADKEVTNLPAHQRARLLAVVPQARKLPGAYTVWQTVLLGRTPHLGWLGQPAQKDRHRTLWALERTDTLRLADRRVEELSGGEQQRVLLARALAQETPILLLDEPTAHLDLHHQNNLLNLLNELAAEIGLAALMAMHDLNLVAAHTGRVALLNGGMLRAIGSPEEVLTPQLLSEVYQVPLDVIHHPEYGTPLVVLDRPDHNHKGKPVCRPSGSEAHQEEVRAGLRLN